MFAALATLVTSYRAAILTFVFLSASDLMLTKFALDFDIAFEANPLMAALFSLHFLAALIFKLLVVLMVARISYHLWYRAEVRTILAAGNLLMLAIIVYEAAGILGAVGV